MAENTATPNQSFNVSNDMPPQGGSKCFDDGGRRTGTVWTASAHIMTALIGTGVLSLAWATAQLGWVAGPAVMLLFSFVTYYTSTLLAACYPSGDPVNGNRNRTYMDAVNSNLGGSYAKICGFVQFVNLFGVAISYTIPSSMSLMAIKMSDCFHKSGGENPCRMNVTPYMIAFGVSEIIFSQIPDFDHLWWVSIVAAVMSFTYSIIGLGLGIAWVAEGGPFKGSLTGNSVESHVTDAQKIWRSFQAVGDIAIAYSYSIILIEIQDTIRAPPAEYKTMKKACLVSVSVTTLLYIMCGCFGYAAFGDNSPGNLLTGFIFYSPYWLLHIANVAILLHLRGAYQLYCQPLFAFIEKAAASRFPYSNFITRRINISIPFYRPCKLNLFRLVWRTIFVIITTVISMLLPFFNDIVGLIGALGFWPLNIYFPVEMYISRMKIPKWSPRWLCLQILSLACLIITIAAAAGSIAGIVGDVKNVKPF